MPRPTSPHLVNRLRHLTLTSPPPTALFYAHLFHALVPATLSQPATHESLHILALCLLQAEQPYPALYLVRETADADLPDEQEHYDSAARQRRQGCHGCAVIMAKCCEKLGRFSEGKAVLERALRRGMPTNVTMPSPAMNEAATHLMLARLSHKGKAPEQAAEAYLKALSDDPWLWEAFTGLCDIGYPPSAEAIFPDPPPPLVRSASSSRTSRPPLSPNPNPMPRSSASEMPALVPGHRRQLSPLAAPGSNGMRGMGGFFTPDVGGAGGGTGRLGMGIIGNPSSWDTPSNMGDTTFPTIAEHPSLVPHQPSKRNFPNLISALLPSSSSSSSILPASMRPTSTPNSNGLAEPPKPPAMKRPRPGHPGHHPRKPALETPQTGPYPSERELRRDRREMKSIEPNGEVPSLLSSDAPVRRSTRLKSGGGPTPKSSSGLPPAPSKVTMRDKRSTRSRSATSSTSGQTVEVPSPPTQEQQLQQLADDWLREVVRRCARAYRHMSRYECKEAVGEINRLPAEIQGSVWALEIVARCFYEMADYTLARRAFKALLHLSPYHLHSLEYYSTTLWHLSDLASLSHLSQTLMSVDRDSPQAWIAAGNCFSLQGDHDEAMRCFKRAAQVDPDNAYAWTLCGYEAVEMEEWERAVGFLRNAIRGDERCYNAWYGMGLVYLRTAKPRHAEHHFRRAAEINPANPVLLCCIGQVLEQNDDIVQALQYYEKAAEMAVGSAMVQFRRARMLVALQRVDEAIAVLEPLARTAPDEANVHFLLGKCYLREGRRGEATVALTQARELQPKLEGAIRSAMEGKDGEEDGEDEGME